MDTGSGPSVVLAARDPEAKRRIGSALAGDGVEVGGELDSIEDLERALATEAPSVVLLDLDLVSGAPTPIRRLAELAPESRILILIAEQPEDTVIAALVDGAYGYLPKASPVEVIAAGMVRATAAGHPVLSPRISAVLIERLKDGHPSEALAESVRGRLTTREFEILCLIAQGSDGGQIADDLVISQSTVKNHTAAILAKLEVENRTQAAVMAVRAGLC